MSSLFENELKVLKNEYLTFQLRKYLNTDNTQSRTFTSCYLIWREVISKLSLYQTGYPVFTYDLSFSLPDVRPRRDHHLLERGHTYTHRAARRRAAAARCYSAPAPSFHRSHVMSRSRRRGEESSGLFKPSLFRIEKIPRLTGRRVFIVKLAVMAMSYVIRLGLPTYLMTFFN